MIGGTMKSLFKSGVRDIKKKFSDQNEDDEFATPFGLRIGAAVDIDTLPLRIHADDLHVELPDETLLIVAQGYVELGDSTYVHRYYTSDDTMIQVLTVAGMKDEHVEELTLFVPYKSYYPDSDGAWARAKRTLNPRCNNKSERVPPLTSPTKLEKVGMMPTHPICWRVKPRTLTI